MAIDPATAALIVGTAISTFTSITGGNAQDRANREAAKQERIALGLQTGQEAFENRTEALLRAAAIERQTLAINQQVELESIELERQAIVKQVQLDEDLRISRLNANLQENQRQGELRSTIATQKALAAGRFDVSTSRSFMALTEETTRVVDRAIQIIRLGNTLTEDRNILEQDQIRLGAETAIAAGRATAAERITILQDLGSAAERANSLQAANNAAANAVLISSRKAAVSAQSTAIAISTVGSLGKLAVTVGGSIANTPTGTK